MRMLASCAILLLVAQVDTTSVIKKLEDAEALLRQTNVGGNVVRIETPGGTATIRLDAHCYCEPVCSPCPDCRCVYDYTTCPHYWNGCPDRLSGPGVFASANNPWCRLRDLDGDGDVDMRDFQGVQ